MANADRIDSGLRRNPSLSIRPDLAKAAHAVTGQNNQDELLGPRGDWWWTGKCPADCPGFDAKAGVLRSLPMPSTHNYTRQALLDYFDNTWTLTEVLFASLQGYDAFVRQPYHQLRHPMMFYYNHPSVLYINKFRVAGLLDEGIDPYFEQLFETGVDEMSWDDLSHARDDWPAVRNVTEYRRKAYQTVKSVIEKHPALDKPDIGWSDMGWAVFMGFEHERIHIETSSVLMRELPLHCVRKPEFWPDYHPSCQLPSAPVPTEDVDYPVNSLVQVSAEHVVLGKDIDYPGYGWDNEYGRRDIDVSAFRASKFKVTNGEFLRFIKGGGYSNPKYWSTEGWGWKTFRNVKWPTFWMPDGPQGLHRYKLRVLFNAIDMRWDWPVDANYHEAKAYCAWKTEAEGQSVLYRIITEAEHNLIRNTQDRVDAWRFVEPAQGGPADGKGGVGAGGARAPAAVNAALNPDLAMLASGKDAEAKLGFNIQLAHSSQNPVTSLPPSSQGFHDSFGSSWEWAEDHYAAFEGFKVHPFYEDFSMPCFAGKHQLILGGSFISTGQLAGKFARYQFRPHFFQHATFRVVQPVVDVEQYDASRYSSANPIYPFVETSCMDGAPPYVGDGPCCSRKRRANFTPTLEEEKRSTRAKLESTQIMYESDTLMAQYLSLHYGPADKVVPEAVSTMMGPALAAHAGLAEELASAAHSRAGLVAGSGRVLDLGCSVGRHAFELSKSFAEVVGVDISKTFIEVATKMKENGHVEYECNVEGNITERLSAALPQGAVSGRCRFVQGDACALPEGLGQFDAVLASNVLDRLPDPSLALAAIAACLKPGGVALISSPFSWAEQYTDRSHWLGGDYKDGRPNRAVDVVKSELAGLGMVLVAEGDVPVLIREHSRKFQLMLAHKLLLRKA